MTRGIADWLPRPLSHSDVAAILEVVEAVGESGKEPDYRAMLAAVRNNPGADLRNVEAHCSGEWAE